jgi:hypothetical protein
MVLGFALPSKGALWGWCLKSADPSPAAGACESQAGGDRLHPHRERGEVLWSAGPQSNTARVA